MYNQQLEVFICVADCGSFTKASERLYISPTAVMKQINSLEEHLNLKLLERTSRGTVLTEAGKSIYKDGKELIRFSSEAIQRAQTFAQHRQCTIRVGTSLLNPCRHLMDLWKQVNDLVPCFKIQVVPFEDTYNNNAVQIEALGTQFDFMVGPCNSARWLRLYNFHKLGEFKICCAVPYNHRLAEKQSLVIEDLFGERLMMVQQGDSEIIDEIRRHVAADYPQITVEDTPFYYNAAVFNRCEQENNVLLTLESWKEVHPFLVTIPMEWDYTMPYGLLYQLNPTEDILRFVELVKTL